MTDDATAGLETGWLPTTPGGDTVEADFIRCMADRISGFARRAGCPVVVDDRVAVPAMSTRTFWGNLGVLRRPDQDAADLGKHLADALPAGTPIALVSPWPDLDLRPAGLDLDGYPPLMIRPVGPGAVPLPTGTTLTEVTDRSGLAEWETTLFEAYPTPGAEQEPELTLFPEALLGSATRFWTVHRDDRAVAVAAAHVSHGVVEVEFIATRESERGRGVGAAITWAATVADPTLPAVLLASDPGRTVYERLGYITTRRWAFWVGTVG